MSRSTRVTTQAAEENTSFHSENGLLVVMSTGYDTRGEISARDDLEQQVGIAVVVVEVSDLVDGQELGLGEAAKAPGEGGIGVLGGELVEHVRGHGEAGGEAVEDGVVQEVFDQRRFADPVRSDEHDVGGVVDEGQGEQLLDKRSVDAFGPVPVEVAGARIGLKALMRALVSRRSRERRLRSRSSISMTRSIQDSASRSSSWTARP